MTVELRELSVSLGGVDVLRGVDWTVDRGEFVGLVGPNGAGKTTLLRTVSGLLEPAAGTVHVDGEDVAALSARESSRLVAVVPQTTHLAFPFDVRRIVEMGRNPHRSRFSPPTPADRAAVDHALAVTRTAELADRPIDEVSGGERQRVLLARAVAQGTPVVLLDEPTASLDVNHQIETLELVRELVAEGRTAVAAIHDLGLAARYCDRLLVLADGGVLARGPPEEVLAGGTVERAFDVPAAVTTDPVTDSPAVRALSPAVDPTELPDAVHVVGSGPTAVGILTRLDALGVDVSAGPVPAGGAVAETARELGVDVRTVEPFSPLGRADLESLDGDVDRAGATVLADLEVGTGNQLALETLADAAPALVVVERRPFEERNHAGDRAAERYGRLRREGVEAGPRGVLEALVRAGGASAGRPPPELPDEPRAGDD